MVYMDRKKILSCLLVSALFGYFAIISVSGVFRLLFLKMSHETVNGTIYSVNSYSTGRYLSYSITCSFTYKDKFNKMDLPITDIFPFVGSVYKEYPVGDTTFLINYEAGIVFPQNNVNMEIRRRLFRFIFNVFVIIFTIKTYSKIDKEEEEKEASIKKSNKRCRKCNTVYYSSYNSCPNCNSVLYEETNQSININLSQVTPFGQPISNNKTLDVTQPENKQDNITDDKKNEEIERLEKIFDSSTDENEKGIIAKRLYDLGKMYYWRFIPRDKIL